MTVKKSLCTLALIITAGCSRAPSFDVMGSFFPAWLVCLIFGIIFAISARWLFQRLNVLIIYPVVVYPCLAALLTFALWLLFFS